ncbi:MAG: hypothetical protein ACXQT3_00190 [Methermicoccaceae archaeon]
MSDVEIEFRKENAIVRTKISEPIRGDTWHEEHYSYNDISNAKLELTITKIQPLIEKGTLKAIVLKVKSYKKATTPPIPPVRKGIFIKDEFIECKNALDITVNVANWLIRHGYLTESDAPVDIGGRTRYLMNSEPVHNSGKRFVSPKRLTNGLWIETHSSKDSHKKMGRKLFEMFGRRGGLGRDDLTIVGFD